MPARPPAIRFRASLGREWISLEEEGGGVVVFEVDIVVLIFDRVVNF